MWWELYRRWTLWDFARRVRKHGWTGTYVHGEGAAFSYSIGFWESAASPDVIMFGMTQEIANGLLWEAHRQLKAGELMLRDKAAWSLDWEDGPQFAWRAVHPSQIRRDHFNIAIWYKERQGGRRSDLKAFQLFVTDTQGLFPWEEGFDADYRPIQPELYLPFFGPADDD